MKNGIFFFIAYSLFLFSSCSESDNANPVLMGQGGSLARFAVSGDHLYVVGKASLTSFDISDPSKPKKIKDIPINVDIETIFPKDNYLYIGAESGMHIFDISDAGRPVKLSTYTHVTSCDPVVVRGNLAYVSLRAGCGFGNTNQLEVIDIADPANPVLLGVYDDLLSPYGLGVVGNYVYLCEGTNGLKILNVQDPTNIFLENEQNIDAYDVIVLAENHLIITGADGIYQYDSTDPVNLQQISYIPVIK